MKNNAILFILLCCCLCPFSWLQAQETLHLTRPLQFDSLLGPKKSYKDSPRESAKMGADFSVEYYFYKGAKTSEETFSINLGINISNQGTRSGYVGCSVIILDSDKVVLGAMSLSSDLQAGEQPARMYMHTGAVPPEKLKAISQYTLDCNFWQ